MRPIVKPVPVRVITYLKAFRSYLNPGDNCNLSSQLIRMGLMANNPPPQIQTSTSAPELLKLPPPLPQQSSSSSAAMYGGNPCLDLFFNVFKKEAPAEAEGNRKYLKQLLPAAWSHNPLTTLKLICNLLDRRPNVGGKSDATAFYTAAFWLHHNHPKTLASNFLPIAGFGYFGGLHDFAEILHRIPAGVDSINSDDENWYYKEEKVTNAREAVAEMYQNDPNYRFLYDCVSDVFVQCLQRDIESLKLGIDESKCLEITMAARSCDDHATLLCESVGRKVFPRESYPEYQGLKEADYNNRVRERLIKEILVPLRKASDHKIRFVNPHSNESGYGIEFGQEPCLAKKYLEDVIKSGKEDDKLSEIVTGALLPHQILAYVDNNVDFGKVAEIQWKAMVEDMTINSTKQGEGGILKKNLNNSLAVFYVSLKDKSTDACVGLALLVSELNQEPAWNGKVINLSQTPELHSIQGLEDLKSRCAFLRSMSCKDSKADFRKVFDLILQVAVNGNLKPDQMIKKVFVFTQSSLSFDRVKNNGWENDYKAIQNKFKEKGYGDVVPEMVFWQVTPSVERLVRPTEQGVALLGGNSNTLVKSFLDNDGEMGPAQVMEATISGEPYQTLVVVD